jgi:hypothetical protein
LVTPLKNHTYGRYYGGCTDVLGRNHAYYMFECLRCGTEMELCTHIPGEYQTEYQWRDEIRRTNLAIQ